MTDQASDASSASKTPKRKGRVRGPAPDTAKKREFILSQPADVSAGHVAKLARQAGLTMSEKFVYRVRGEHKSRGTAGKKKAPSARGTAKKTSPKRRPSAAKVAATAKAGRASQSRASTARTVDQALLVLALEHGLVSVVKGLERLRANANKMVTSVL